MQINTENSDRSKKVYINSIITIITQISQVLLGFIIRKVFIEKLSVEYLGYNSVFSNLLQMLNLADMGVGIAITSYLYKPLANKENDRISVLMHLYKKMYEIIGLIVLGIGIIISFFINKIIPDAQCSLLYLRILFYINLLGTVSSYFLAYNRTLMIADQKSYVVSIIDAISFITFSIFQIIFLLVYPNYVVYLILAVAKNVVSNIIVLLFAKKTYKLDKNNINKRYIEEYKPKIYSFVKDVFISRIGAYVFYSTDNIIISSFKGSLLTGYLSNYTLITNQLQTFITQMLSSIQATFGNYIVTNKEKNKNKEMTINYYYANFIIGNFCLICIICLMQQFIELYLGKNYLLPISTTILLAINLMLTILLQLPSQIFQIYKLYNYDKKIIGISAILNIIISVALVGNFGINGCLIGTLITSLIYLFSRLYIISSKVFNDKFSEYLKVTIKFFIISIISTLIIYFLNIKFKVSFKWFIIRALIVAIEAILLTIIFIINTKEYHFLKNRLINDRLKKYFSNKIIIAIFTIFTIISLLQLKSINIDDYKAEKTNKSLIRTDSYEIDNSSSSKKIFEFSIDDSINIFEDIYKNNYDSIFENEELEWLKSLHEKTNGVITLYCFYENGDFNLSKMSNKYYKEFNENSNWLRVGFHSLNGAKNYSNSDSELAKDFQKTTYELERICGEKSIDNIIRLQNFAGNEDGIMKISNNINEPIIGLYTSDDKRNNYFLDNNENNYIYCHDIMKKNDLYFISTDLRIEFIKNMKIKEREIENTNSWNNQKNILCAFTHEWELSYENKEKIEELFEWAKKQGYKFTFLEDIL